MTLKKMPAFLCYFDDLEDPRIDRKKLYPLTEILFIVLCWSICGAQSWRDFVTFGEDKLDYLLQKIPSLESFQVLILKISIGVLLRGCNHFN